MENISIKKYLTDLGIIDQKSGYLDIPDWVKRIRIDVGLSSNAPHSSIWLSEDENLLVFGFEPNHRNIEKLRSGTSDWPIKIDKKLIDKKLILIPMALGNVNGVVKRKFYDTKIDSGQSSIYKPKGNLEILNSYSVDCCNISEFINLIPQSRFPVIEYLKTDCQGADFEILLSSKPVLKRIAVYTLELERLQYEGTNFSDDEVNTIFKKERFFRYNLFNALLNNVSPLIFSTKDSTFINKELTMIIKEAKAKFTQLG